MDFWKKCRTGSSFLSTFFTIRLTYDVEGSESLAIDDSRANWIRHMAHNGRLRFIQIVLCGNIETEAISDLIQPLLPVRGQEEMSRTDSG